MIKTEISFVLDTIEDLRNNHKFMDEYFLLLENLIKNGNQLAFYWIDGNEKLTLIKDLNHLENFKKSFKYIR